MQSQQFRSFLLEQYRTRQTNHCSGAKYSEQFEFDETVFVPK